jgi:uncharacterized protein (DUF849 family)
LSPVCDALVGAMNQDSAGEAPLSPKEMEDEALSIGPLGAGQVHAQIRECERRPEYQAQDRGSVHESHGGYFTGPMTKIDIARSKP